MFDGRFRKAVEGGVAPVGSSLGSRRLKADYFTALGLVLSAAAAIVIGSGHLLLGMLAVVLAAVPDLLDGAVAKATGTASVRGAFFDSVADRVADSLILGGVAWHLASSRHAEWAVLPMAILAVSNLVSYERAKAESLGFQAKGGLMERAERIIVLCVGLAFPVVLIPVLWVMLGLTTFTAAQRFVKVWRQAPGPEAAASDSAAEQLRAERAQLRSERAASRAQHSLFGGSPDSPSRWREWREAREAELRNRREAHRAGTGGRLGDADQRDPTWRDGRHGPGATPRRPARGSWRRGRTHP